MIGQKKRKQRKKIGTMVNCSFCNKSIYRQPNEVKRYADFFCDQKCKSGWQKINLIGKYHPIFNPKTTDEMRGRQNKFTHHCIDCGVLIRHESERCKPCFFITRQRREKIVCKVCGKEVFRQLAYVKKFRSAFCSRKCLYIFTSGGLKGRGRGISFSDGPGLVNSKFWRYYCRDCGFVLRPTYTQKLYCKGCNEYKSSGMTFDERYGK